MPPNRVRPPLRQDEDSNDAGFTVLEALVSFVLFAVLAGASTTAIVNATQRRIPRATASTRPTSRSRTSSRPDRCATPTIRSRSLHTP